MRNKIIGVRKWREGVAEVECATQDFLEYRGVIVNSSNEIDILLDVWFRASYGFHLSK
jgi:hypothetical protein